MASQLARSARRLPPHQVDCIWWKKGYCHRGTKCFFRHDAALAGVDKDKDHTPQTTKSPESDPPATSPSAPSTGPASSETREPCAICLDTPVTYGLLIHCDHVFCLDCIRSWRSSSKPEEPEDYPTDQAALSKTTKTCPLCRKKSAFVIPSSIFPTPPSSDISAATKDIAQASGESGAEEKKNPVKDEIIQGYLEKLKKIPCRYFEEESKRLRVAVAAFEAGDTDVQSLTKLKFRPRCGFANQCHYAHIDPVTNKPYIFSQLEIKRMKRKRLEERAQQLRAGFQIGHSAHLEMITRGFETFAFERRAAEGAHRGPHDIADHEINLQDLHLAFTMASLDAFGHPET
ncbi:predicted protein [Uncinocarpus reesii 1704]|uniref:Uncharacterized protein n=1 Tax=Uncinocarpus reesii (strain UAMH 1704) TaxID=336963 RepID=C4JYE8_UNCRE|nr:uncharacterized protein UREG_07199 [Uncinocarpus reesii 1704]EEP82334.1 predicted protein [Uncinocarpus reesii 1704]